MTPGYSYINLPYQSRQAGVSSGINAAQNAIDRLAQHIREHAAEDDVAYVWAGLLMEELEQRWNDFILHH